MNPAQTIENVVRAAVLWHKTKKILLTLSDRKSAKAADVAEAKRKHLEAVSTLDAAVTAFLKLGVLKKAPKKPFPWKSVLDIVATASGTLKEITDPKKTTVIDAQAE